VARTPGIGERLLVAPQQQQHARAASTRSSRRAARARARGEVRERRRKAAQAHQRLRDIDARGQVIRIAREGRLERGERAREVAVRECR
jgi:hypothetical protein